MRRISLLSSVLLIGCQAIVGIEDTQSADDDPVTVDAAVDDTDAPQPDAAPGQPDAEVAGFALGGLPLRFAVPLDGTNELDVSITRSGGFEGDVTISVSPITGLTAPDVVLTGTQTEGRLLLSLSNASGLSLGNTFDFTVVATAAPGTDSGTVEGEVVGAPGTLDPSFGTAGIVSDIRDGASDDTPMNRILELPDGDIVSVGTNVGGLGSQEIITVRLQATGARDTTFSGDGKALQSVGSGFSVTRGFDVVQHSVDKLLVIGDVPTGTDDNDVVMLHYNTGGGHDVLFGSPFADDLGGSEGGRTVVTAFDDSFAVGGTKDGAALVVRYNALGGRINSFGTNGVQTFDLTGDVDEVVTIAFVGGQLMIVVAADTTGGNTGIMRLTAGGDADPTYPQVMFSGVPRDAVFAADGSVFVTTRCAGTTCVAKFDPTGAPDTTFGTDGVAMAPINGVETMALLASGKIVVAGNVGNDPWLVRFRADGSIDETFDSNGAADGRGGGVVVAPLGLGGGIRDITQAANGDILICGVGTTGASNSGLVARLRQ